MTNINDCNFYVLNNTSGTITEGYVQHNYYKMESSKVSLSALKRRAMTPLTPINTGTHHTDQWVVNLNLGARTVTVDCDIKNFDTDIVVVITDRGATVVPQADEPASGTFHP